MMQTGKKTNTTKTNDQTRTEQILTTRANSVLQNSQYIHYNPGINMYTEKHHSCTTNSDNEGSPTKSQSQQICFAIKLPTKNILVNTPVNNGFCYCNNCSHFNHLRDTISCQHHHHQMCLLSQSIYVVFVKYLKTARSQLVECEKNKLHTFSGSLLRQSSTKSLNCLPQSPVNCGGLFLGIRKSTRIGCRSELGGSPLASSIAVIPKLHMSACSHTNRNHIIFAHSAKLAWPHIFI